MKKPKTATAGALIIFALSGVAHAAPLTLDWDRNPPSEKVTAYQLSELIDGVAKPLVKVAAPPATIDATPGPHKYVVTALNEREGPPSEPLTVPLAPSTPTGLKVVDIQVQVSVNGVPVLK